MSILAVESFRLAPDDQYPLFVTAKRYRYRQKDASQQSAPTWKGKRREHDVRGEHDANRRHRPAPTLIVLHSTSFHKETWEATLETLFRLHYDAQHNACSPEARFDIEEAWAIECPNHGESASMNAHVLSRPPYETEFGCRGYAQAIHRFLTRGPVLFSDRTLVGVGHSLGANSLLLLQDLLSRDSVQFRSLILAEPMVNPGGPDNLDELRTRLVGAARRRKDSWESREAVRRFLRGRVGGGDKEGKGKWDERVIEAFSNFGVRAVPPDGSTSSTGVLRQQKFVLACTRQQEEVMYTDDDGSTAPVEALGRISWRLPVHLILGVVKDFIPAHVHDTLIDPASSRRYASIAKISDVGHLIPQEKPGPLAVAIHQALVLDFGRLCQRSKL
ncbi:hypothetical protein FA15DRAFT_621926 [Coprinopsis marcescibilis]|uniref:AB hydrolase-1 domain-containing protein n=1 Tax=Coprinopsis marcescibilis TaxID=230819 RepID=A0A5C3KQY5_COPMA|nr:hypothetical protein FA15DRAFT_621926 [Coprinopsis marcescibilis]